MKHRFLKYILTLSVVLQACCASNRFVGSSEIISGQLEDNGVYKICSECDLKGTVVSLPENSVLVFKKGGTIKNGTLIGSNVKIEFEKPFIGESIIVRGCTVRGKRVLKDKEVFISVAHTQNEIQTLFDISGGIKIEFSKGVYQNVEKIVVNNNVDADFNNGTINLNYDKNYVGECFYMEADVNKHPDFFRIKNLAINGKIKGIKGSVDRRCIQLFNVSEVELDNININEFYGGPQRFKEDSSDLLDKTRIGTSSVAIMYYNKCIINNCRTNDISNEIFWCVPNSTPNNMTYFTNNKSICSSSNGSSSFFTILDGRCVVKGNEVYNYNGSAFNTFCYDSEISNNKFYDGKRSVAIDLSEGTMYRAKNVNIHDNFCFNTKGLVAAYGEKIRLSNNHWLNSTIQKGDRIYVITISTREGRTKGGRYIGCDNNPEHTFGSKDIVIENNECVNEGSIENNEIRFACLWGDDIVMKNNSMIGLNVPVVQLVDGDRFDFKDNAIRKTEKGHYTELLINRGRDLSIQRNSFSRNHVTSNMNCTVRVLVAEGVLTYKGNMIDADTFINIKGQTYVPCLVEDYTKLDKVGYFVNRVDSGMTIKTGLDSRRMSIRTNLKRN